MRGCCGPYGDDAMFEVKLFHVLIYELYFFFFFYVSTASRVSLIRLARHPRRRKVRSRAANTVGRPPKRKTPQEGRQVEEE